LKKNSSLPIIPTFLFDLIVRHEGIRLKPYKDSLGNITIGVGRNLDGVGITENEAMILLFNDIRTSIQEAEKNFKWYEDLGDIRKTVIISMIFNLGITKFKGFRRMIAAMELKDYSAASDEMIDSRWYEQVRDRGSELSFMMRKGASYQ